MSDSYGVICMGRLNEGTVFTNQKCIACNKCVAYCNNFGANVSVTKGEKRRIEVDGSKCVECGKCIEVCTHEARSYKDDCDAFFDALEKGEKLSVIVSSSFYVYYSDIADEIFGYLKSIGVEKIYDCSYGAEICTWCMVKYLKEHEASPSSERAFIAPVCASFVNDVEYNRPELLEKLIPVQSPEICTAIYAHKYLGDTNRIAYLSPCIAAREEITAASTEGNISFNVTFDNFMYYISGIDITPYSGVSDLKSHGIGDIVPLTEGLREIVSCFFDRGVRTTTLWGLKDEHYQKMIVSSGSRYASVQPIYTDVLACGSGCQSGSGCEMDRRNDVEFVYEECARIRKQTFSDYNIEWTPEEHWEHFEALFTDCNAEDFTRTFENHFEQPQEIPEYTIENIYKDMFKDTPEKRLINCGSCGYSSCSEMVKAIACGYNRKENCIHYMNESMHIRYTYNQMTGLYNEVAFMNVVSEMLKKKTKKKYCVCYVDINKLKMVNDIYGFDVGEKVLKHVANNFKKYEKKGGVASYLGAGSYLLFNEYSEKFLKELADKRNYDFGYLGVKHLVTLRFGVYVVEDPNENIRSIINYAAMASKEKSSTIQNTVEVFSPKSRENLFKEAEISTKMIKALENHEFVLFFQPQYSSSTHTLVGAEALCRWIDSDGVIISPSVFIPIAEGNGFIKTLDREVWKMAFSTVRKWLDEGLVPPSISVNVSRISMESDDMVEFIAELQKEYRVPNKYIHFEITESADFGNQDQLIDRINKIRSLGYLIAMDDFGSGYSSLNTLKDIPIDILKLDMGFLREATNMDKGGTIISAVARMAQNLELVTVAEGVETPQQADFLRSVGVNVIQGYVYAKPMEKEKFVEQMKLGKVSNDVSKESIFSSVDFNRFLEPGSYENMLFEQFTGPAVVLEYNALLRTIDIIMLNRKGSSIFSCDETDFNEIRKIFERFLKTSRGDVVFDMFDRVILSHKEEICVVNMHDQRTQAEIFVRIHCWEVNSAEEKHVLFVILEDISGERIAESMNILAFKQMTALMKTEIMGYALLHVRMDLQKLMGSLESMDSLEVKILTMNDELISTIGVPREDIMNWNEKTLLGIIHQDDRSEYISKFAAELIKDANGCHTFSFRACLQDGRMLNVTNMCSTQKLEDGSYMIATYYTWE